jgi:germination protein M
MKKILSVILCSVIIFTLAGCGRAETKNENNTKEIVKEKTKEVNTAAKVEQEKIEETKSREVVLYFSDDQAMYLVGEKRSIEDPTAKSIVAELVKGPIAKSETKLYETLPKDLEVIDVQVKDGIATVDFKSSATEKISGGSTGEGMALYSIINTLIFDKELGISKVQFLVEGKNVESIKGHYDVKEPLGSDIEKIKK